MQEQKLLLSGVNNRPLIMAHRGDQANAPENTIIAMKNCVKSTVDVLESDVRITKDDELVLFHDDTLDRTTNFKGEIIDYTLDELMEVDLGYKFTPDGGKTYPYRGKGLKIVTLRQAFEIFKDFAFNLDIKNSPETAPQAPSLLADLIREYQKEETVLVASFHPRQLEKFRKICPSVVTSAHPKEVKKFLISLKLHLLGLFIRNPSYRAFQIPLSYNNTVLVTPRFIKAAHSKNIAVHVWTINDREIMIELIDLGVDGIFTDDPALLIAVLKEKGLL